MNDFTNTLLVQAAAQAALNPIVAQNRARAAALVELGFEGLDTYNQYRSTLFVVALLGATASGYALYRRRNAEARALYSITGLISVAAAWLTRPDAMRAALPPPAEGETAPAPSTARTMGWIDNRVDKLTAEQPGWEGVTWQRLANDLGTGTMNPAVTALLTQGTR